MTSSFVNFVLADSQRSLFFPVIDYVPAVTRWLAAFYCKPHEIVIIIDVSCPWW